MIPNKDKTGKEFFVTWRCPMCNNVSVARQDWAACNNKKTTGTCEECDHTSEESKKDFLIEVWVKKAPSKPRRNQHDPR